MMKHRGLDIAQTIISKEDGSFIDVTDRLTVQPVITQVVNNESTAKFSVVNNIVNPLRNLLSNQCERWSNNHVGPVEESDRVVITYINQAMSINHPIFRGIISTIECNEDTLNITAVDAIAELKKIGATYFRNHYREAAYVEKPLPVASDGGQNPVFILREDSAPIEAGTAKFAINMAAITEPNTSGMQLETAYANYAEMIYNTGNDWITSVSVQINSVVVLAAGSNMLIEVRADGAGGPLIGSYGINAIGNIPIPITPTKSSIVYIKVTANGVRISLGMNIGGGSNRQFRINYPGTYYNWTNGSFAVTLGSAKYYPATGVNEYSSTFGYIYRISYVTIGGSQVGLSAGDLSPSFVRGWGMFLPTTAKIQAKEIIGSILDAHDYILLGGVNTNKSFATVNLFRCGGDFVHNYLLTMVDLESTSGSWAGYQCVIFSDIFNHKSIALSRRMKVTDIPRFKIAYAPDDVQGATWLMQFSPVKTMANRPVTSFVQGQTEDGLPIMIAVTDIRKMVDQRNIDLSSIAFESNVSSVVDAAKSAYADVMQYARQEWEGTLQLSGIHNAFVDNPNYRGYIDIDISSETYGSGVPISITDSRYGMDDMRVIVKEVVYDFKDLTTKITLSNYSIPNSNAIKDNSKMALRAGGIATDAINENLQLRQYILVRTNGQNVGQNNTIQIKRAAGSPDIASATADTLIFPELKMTLLSALFPASSFNVKDHGIIAIGYNNGTMINLKESRRPDKNVGQSLIVNIQIQHP